MLSNLLWLIIILAVIFWFLGAFVWNVGALIHLLLVIAVLVLVYQVVTGRRSV